MKITSKHKVTFLSVLTIISLVANTMSSACECMKIKLLLYMILKMTLFIAVLQVISVVALQKHHRRSKHKSGFTSSF